MLSAILISNLRKSLYTRLYYSLVDSDYLIKALSNKEIQTMIDTVSRDTMLIRDLKEFNEDKVSFISFQNPEALNPYFEKVKGKIEEQYPDKTIVDGKLKYSGQQEKRGKLLAQQIRDYLKPQLQKDYPDNEKIESLILLDYIKRVHGGDVDEIKAEIKAYKKDQDTKTKTKLGESSKERKEKDKKNTLLSQKADKKLADWRKQLESQKETDYEKQPKSVKLFDDWAQQVDIRGKDTYKIFLSLISLVGSLDSKNEESILRLKKFLRESKDSISQEDSVSLDNILTELEKENKEYNTVVGRKLNVTRNAINAKSHGMDVGKASKFNPGKDNKNSSLTLKYSDDQTLKLRRDRMNLFKNFSKFDMRNTMWINHIHLREITDYWIEKAGYGKGLQSWLKEDNDTQTKYIKEVNDILPDYPTINSNPLKVALASVYNNIWVDYEDEDSGTSAEDFSYFLRGIQSGLSGLTDDITEDFNKLRNFKESILPTLIKTVKSGILIELKEDGTRVKSFRLGPVFSKAMSKLGNDKIRRGVVKDFISIIANKSLSNKYVGRDAAELKSIEEDVIDLVKQEIDGVSIASYIVSTFKDMYGKTIIRDIFKDKDTAVDIEYLETQYNPERKTPQKRKEYDDAIDRKKVKPVKKPKVKTTSKPTKQDLSDLDEQGPKSPFNNSLKETKKSLDNLLIVMREKDNIILKEDVGTILESLNKKQRKKVKAILNIADPTEYFGHDFLKLEDLIKVLKSLGVVKGDKKLNKKILNLEDENLKVVKLATRLRKDYEILYRDLREMVYPKSGE